MNRSNAGFTLLELLVALAIFGLVSVIAFSGLDSSLQTSRKVEIQSERLVQLQKTFNLMRGDLEQAVARPVRDQLGDSNPKNAFMEVENGILFTRGGRQNPLELARSSLQRVGWGEKDGKLVRVRYAVLDQPTEPAWDESVVLERVESLSFRFLTEENGEKRWLEQWPPLNRDTPDEPELPHAVEVTVELEDMGEITRIFLLPY